VETPIRKSLLSIRNNYLLSPLAVAISIASLPAIAQDDLDDFALEEVVVTAQKRAQSLQDVPISVSAVGGEKLAEAGIENLQDLSAYVPNLKIVEGGLVPQLYIRGIGSGANQGFEQSVGTYSDGIYMGRSLQSRGSFLDLERVEVLRGPQSILFGQSSIAGAISLVSAKPTDEFEGMISASHAPKHDDTEINFYASGPLTEDFKARLAVRDRQEDGYLKNRIINEDAPELDEQAARLTLGWDVNDSLETLLKIETASIERDNGRPGQVTDYGGYPVTATIPLTDPAELDHNQYSNNLNSMEFDSDAYVLNVNYELSNGVTFTSITSYTEFDYDEENYDGEASEVDLLSLDMDEQFDQFSQEFRLTSPGGETVDYIIGVFYQESDQEYQEDASLVVSSLSLPSPFDSLVMRNFQQETETWAAFAQATWNVSEELRFTLGLRYTRDEKDATRTQDTFSINFPGVSQSGISAIDGLPCAISADCSVLVSTALGGTFGLIDHTLEDDFSKTNWTPSVNAQYDITPDIMLYATYSEGYKAGGYDARGINDSTSSNNPFSLPILALGGDNFGYDQEEAETIELGAKMSLLDNTAELNIAIYQTDYTDMQISTFDGTFGFNVFNAGEATVRGMEMDGRWRPTASVLLTAGIAYLDFEWQEYEEAACPRQGPAVVNANGNCDASGRENLQTPEWTANLSANHVLPIGDAFELRTTLDANFKDNHYTANDLDDRSEQSGATIYNMRVALASADDKWHVAVIGKNLTDKVVTNYNVSLSQGITGSADNDGNGLADGGRTAQINRPRTVAIEGLYRF
jgi:iron complex outermembrane recepter protein